MQNYTEKEVAMILSTWPTLSHLNSIMCLQIANNKMLPDAVSKLL